MSQAAVHRSPARFDASSARARSRRRSPGFIEPCHPTLREEAPSGERWVHEIKFDGYRTQAHLRNGRPAIYTRRAYDWTRRFQPIADALAALPAEDLILDGEAVVADSRGIPDFGLLHADLAAGRKDRLLYYAFDLLYLDGFDLRGAPLAERKRSSPSCWPAPPNASSTPSTSREMAAEIYQRACAMGLEGIVSKQQDAPYRSRRVESWIKVKCGNRDAFPIIAFVEKLGAKPRRIASLYVGRREGDRLLYAGKVRGGYTEAVARDLRERLDPFIRKDSPLSEPVNKPKATWVEPVIEAEVAYSTLTENNLLREAVFKGLREDQQSPARPCQFAGHPAQRAADVGRAYRARTSAAPCRMRWSLRKRNSPRIGRRSGSGRCRTSGAGRSSWSATSEARPSTTRKAAACPGGGSPAYDRKARRRRRPRLWVDDLAGLLGLVEIGAVEMHPWNASIDDIEHPDMLVFDLDPGEGVAWEFVIETALSLRRMLRNEGLEPWPKLTGGQGIAPDGAARSHNRPRSGASLRQAARAAPRCNRTRPLYYLLRPGKAHRAHFHRLPAKWPWHDGHRCVVATRARRDFQLRPR